MKMKYNLGLLTCEIAFENFINFLINEMLMSKGLSEDAAFYILKSMNNIQVKVYKLLLHLDNINFKEYKKHKRWEELANKRNEVGHGKIAEISREEAEESFEVVIKAILYIAMRTSLDLNIHFQ